MTWLLSLAVPTLIVALWLSTASLTRTRVPTLTGKRIWLVIAHPDDEAMFFAPTLRALGRRALGNRLAMVSFSTGDADGLGAVRRRELVRSARLLGVARDADVVVVDDPRHFPDSMRARWDEIRIARTLARLFAPHDAAVDVLITFDRAGVSRHPNHVALFHGCVAFVRALRARGGAGEPGVQLYTLTTTNVVRKYASIVDAAVTGLGWIFRANKEKGPFPTPLVMVSMPGDVRRAQEAMTTAHKSQMRWFRWGWIGISRYMVINDLNKQNVV